LISFPPATEMFQFAGFASFTYGFSEGSSRRMGFPHSDIVGSKLARSSPTLFAACHVLHRLLAPRHPPDALLCLRTCPRDWTDRQTVTSQPGTYTSRQRRRNATQRRQFAHSHEGHDRTASLNDTRATAQAPQDPSRQRMPSFLFTMCNNDDGSPRPTRHGAEPISS
jgi:hypothetical protein